MAYKKFFYSFLPFLFTIYSFGLSAQDSLKLQNQLSDTLNFNNNSRREEILLQGELKEPLARRSHYLKPTALIVPGAFLIYGGLKPVINGIPKLDKKIMSNIQEKYPGFHTTAADYLMWAPSAYVYATDAFHVKMQHNFKEHLILEAGSFLVTGALGFGMRKISEKINAYKSEYTKFPSGHTANAFRGAEIVHQELKFNHPILSYSGYVLATGVGILRMYNKEHFLSEVLAGAGLGILSTKLTYWIFQKVKDKK